MLKKGGALIKVSGSIIVPEYIEALCKELSVIAKKYKLYILCGGGAAISAELEKHGIAFEFIDGQRVIKDLKGVEIATDVLEKKACFLDRELTRRRITAVIKAPMTRFGDIMCHVNGDAVAKGLAHNFARTFVFTLSDKDKSSLQGEIRNLEIIYISI